MSVRMIQAFKKSGLPATERIVAYMLADHHNEGTGRCDPSIPILASETGLCERSVIRAIDRIQAAGHLTIEKHQGVRHKYQLHPVPTPDSQSRVTGEIPLTHSHPTPDSQSGGPVTLDTETPDSQSPEPEEPEVNQKEPGAGGRSAPCSEDQAFAYAQNIMVSPKWTRGGVEKWFADRSLRSWTTKGGIRLKPDNWMHDLRGAHNWAMEQPRNTGQPPAKKKIMVG